MKIEKGYIVINLLPYREKLKKEKIRQLSLVLGFFAVCAAAVVFVMYSLMNYELNEQEQRNSYIANENKKLDADIKEIANLKNEIKDTLAKRQVVESLQVNRSDAVSILNDISNQLPENTTLKWIKQEGSKITIVGDTTSNNKVSNYMTNLSATNFFINPELVEVKSVQVASSKANSKVSDDQNLNEFTMNVYLKPPVEDEDSTSKKKFKNKKQAQ
jgi:type IV pilus assembly protein PilN